MVDYLKEIFVALLPNTKRIIDKDDIVSAVYAFDDNKSYGVFIQYFGLKYIEEKFNSICLHTGNIDGNNVLLLSCEDKGLSDKFAYIAADFLTKGENNNYIVTENPFQWFNKWKETIGNYKKDLMVYDVIGEMKCVIELNKRGQAPRFSSINFGTHDIECIDGAYEVKSTILKSQSLVHISSGSQMERDDEHALFILFCKLEKCELGYSIDDLRNQLILIGYCAKELNDYLEIKGYPQGKEETNIKYIVREINKYIVDESFPKITSDSFKDGKFPDGVVSINYAVDLANLPYEKYL